MKHNLTLTDLIVNTDFGGTNKVNIEIIATINGKMIKHISRPLVLTEGPYYLAIIRNEFEMALSAICLQAMTIDEKLTTFNLKQTASFSNAVHANNFCTSSITTAIW